MKIALVVAALIVVAPFAVQLVLSGRFRAELDALNSRLVAAQAPSTAPDQSLIPALVRDFAARSGGRTGGPSTIRMVQSAEMRLKPDQAFFHIDAIQLSGTRDPGYVWHATGVMAKVVPVQVVDSYVAGAGLLEARIAGSIRVAHAVGPDIDKGEAMRFLAELPWNPDAMVNATGLTWREVDEHTVEVSMRTQSGVARVSLLFDASGDIVGIEAKDRPWALGNVSAPPRWVGRFAYPVWSILLTA
jgi:hypothetical protein